MRRIGLELNDDAITVRFKGVGWLLDERRVRTYIMPRGPLRVHRVPLRSIWHHVLQFQQEGFRAA